MKIFVVVFYDFKPFFSRTMNFISEKFYVFGYDEKIVEPFSDHTHRLEAHIGQGVSHPPEYAVIGWRNVWRIRRVLQHVPANTYYRVFCTGSDIYVAWRCRATILLDVLLLSSSF